MLEPTVQTRMIDEDRNIKVVFLGYRELTMAERLSCYSDFLRKNRKAKNKSIVIHTIFGFDK
jgi:hypothetical protein